VTGGAVVCDRKKTPSKNFEGASGGRKRLTGIIPSLGHGGAKPENQSSIDEPNAHADSGDYQLLREITVTHLLQVLNCKTESFISRLLSDSFAPD
jgi:hypothetical protein